MDAGVAPRMDAGLDTGPVCLAERVPIGPDTTAGELHDTLAERGAGLLVLGMTRLVIGRYLDALARACTAAAEASSGAPPAAP